MRDKEREDYIINRLHDIEDIASELARMGEPGPDGNLEEMANHIRIYSTKIIKHLLHNWSLNERVEKRRAEKAKVAAAEKAIEDIKEEEAKKQSKQKFIERMEKARYERMKAELQ